MRRLIVILVALAVIAGLVILAGGEGGATDEGIGVLRRPESQASAPTFAAGEAAVPLPDDVRDLTPAGAVADEIRFDPARLEQAVEDVLAER